LKKIALINSQKTLYIKSGAALANNSAVSKIRHIRYQFVQKLSKITEKKSGGITIIINKLLISINRAESTVSDGSTEHYKEHFTGSSARSIDARHRSVSAFGLARKWVRFYNRENNSQK